MPDTIGGMSSLSQLVNSNPSGTVTVPGIRPPVSHVTAINVPQQVTQSPCKCIIINSETAIENLAKVVKNLALSILRSNLFLFPQYKR